MPPQVLRLPLLRSQAETPSVTTFRFDLGGRTIDYRPGQYALVKLDQVQDPRGPQRQFTLSSSPTEDGFVAITTRLTGSPFKERLAALRAGEEAELRAAMGVFTLENGRPAVMLAGGIGITPFRSMIRYAADRGLDLPLALLYSCRTPDEIAFKTELDEVARTHRNLRLMYTVTRPDRSSAAWDGRTGRFGAREVRDAANGLGQALYYVCGSGAMVDGATRMLAEELRIAPDDVRSEDFPGY